MQNQRLEAIDASGHGLRVEFEWRGDRFGHSIVLVSGGAPGSIPLLKSIEGTAGEAWPPSPPLQSLSLETLPDGRKVALLVGMAGRSHWSASIEALPDRPALVFDIACRRGQEAEALGSAYQPAAGTDERRNLICAAGTALQEDERALRFFPQVQASVGSTVRWKYTVELKHDAAA
jgi:hypothetical protein